MKQLIFLFLLFAPAITISDGANPNYWVNSGSYDAKVLSMNTIEEPPSANFNGLIIQCSPSKARARVKLHDVVADKGTVVEYKTDKDSGSFITDRDVIVASDMDDFALNNHLIAVIKRGKEITFTVNDVELKYTLKGSTKAITSLKSCGNYYKSVKVEKTKKTAKVKKGGKWYEGGTLHEANALEWQEADSADKLATCSDFIAGLWNNKKLSDEIMSTISSVDHFKPYAEELVIGLNNAFKKDDDPGKNKTLYTNQRVGETAVILMVIMKWLKQ